MSPWEIAAFVIVLPVVVIAVWLNERFAADGPRVPEFEAWCRDTRPTLLAVMTTPARAAAVAEELRAAVLPRGEVEHSGGTYPWTRHVLVVSVEHAAGDRVVRMRAERAFVRRASSRRPDLPGLVQRVLTGAAGELDAVWMHTELRDGDDARGAARRGRGWLAAPAQGTETDFQLVPEAPAWVSAS